MDVPAEELAIPKNGAHTSQRRATCVALGKNKKTVKVEGNRPEEFLPTLRGSTLAWINFVVDDISIEGEGIATSLGFSQAIVTTLLSSYQSNYEDREAELGIRVPAVSPDGMDVRVYPLVILIRKGVILSIHETAITRLVNFSRYAETFMRKIKPDFEWQDKVTLLLWRILDENNSKNFDHLRGIEEQADRLVKELMDPKTPRDILGPYIYKMKHALIVYLDALWATLDVINTLRYGDAETLTDDKELLDRISALSNNVTTQISISEHMSEVLASGLEVLQSIYNNQLQILNNRLALVVTWLTVLGTAVLVPNTLATIFGMSVIADNVDGGALILILIVSTVLAIIGSFWFVTKAGMMPKHVE